MKKNYVLFAAALMALASCQTDDYLGNNTGNAEGTTESAIRFDGYSGKVTRTDEQKTGEKAAAALGKKFVVYGYKTTDNVTSTVYDHYSVEWKGLNNKSESNKVGWEYVGLAPNTLSELAKEAIQSIKYWDYSASQYDFIAFSFGEATQGTGANQVEATRVITTGESAPSYTLKGNVTDLAKCYIADRITAKKDVTEGSQKKANKLIGYQDNVQFNFRSLSSKVTMGIYETIPGYSVKNVVFYTSETQKAANASDETNKPTLYAASENIPSGTGKMTVTFGSTESSATDFNQAKVAWEADKKNNTNVKFGKLSVVGKEHKEKVGSEFIGRDITNVSIPKNTESIKTYETVLPGTKVGSLTLKVDYTLEATDGSGETIKVTGATAVIPEVYTQWKPNYAYTYIFKISDKTNGSTSGGDDPKGLYPIVFDAIVTETETGKQETITEIGDASITTYAKGAIGNEYVGGSNIYVSVKDGDLKITYTTTTGENEDATTTTTRDSNCELYRVTATNNNLITEANVASVLANKSNAITVTKVKDETTADGTKDSDRLSIKEEIDAKDTVDGNAIKGNFAMFKANTPSDTNPIYYAFEYTKDSNKYYKVIKVVAPSK